MEHTYEKISPTTIALNLSDYESVSHSFNWNSSESQMDGRREVKWLNIVYEAVGRPAIGRLRNRLTPNCIQINNAYLFRVYLHEEVRFKICFNVANYISIDLARRDRDWYYWFKEWADDLIKCFGQMIAPFEV